VEFQRRWGKRTRKLTAAQRPLCPCLVLTFTTSAPSPSPFQVLKRAALCPPPSSLSLLLSSHRRPPLVATRPERFAIRPRGASSG